MKNSASERNFRAEVRENIEVSKGHYLMSFEPQGAPPAPRPGQFYMVGKSESNDPLLKRPFCFFGKADNSIRILYRLRGKGTALLSRMRTGDVLSIVGPLGNSWPRPGGAQTPLIVAGGIGIASVFALAASLKKAAVIYGGRNSHELPMLEEVKAVCQTLHITTEDGSVGTKGTVMDALASLDIDSSHVIYTCGPKGMLRAVAEFAAKKGLKGYASLEEKMACGMGACLGCAVMTTKGIREVCTDGPVFKLEETVWKK